MILFKISAFIWEIIFSKTRVMYIFVVRSIMIYVFAIGHMSKSKKTNIENKLTVLQNKCLRNVSKIFRIISISILKIETHIVSMHIHLNYLQITIRLRLRIELVARFIVDSCKAIICKLRDQTDRRRKHRVISKKIKHDWTQKQLTIIIDSFVENFEFVSWMNRSRIAFERDKFIKQRIPEIKKHHDKQWKNMWTTYQRIVLDSISTQTEFINKKRLKLHEQFRKVESSLTTHIRTKKIELANFLHRRKVLEMKSSTCRCEWNRQTTKHVIMFCSMMIDRYTLWRDVKHFDYNQMMHSNKFLKIIVKWLIKHDLLTQYALASKLLYIHWLRIYTIFFLFSFSFLVKSCTRYTDAAMRFRTLDFDFSS
jgi:hypothetical protein